MTFDEANQEVHLVERQWHHHIMAKHGYVADTKVGVGFVRSYRYTHPVTKHSMSVTTGVSSDHWDDAANSKFGYWGSLDQHLASLPR